ncbi:hypothetical protein M5X11_25570 [Paenibacillus alginolyticus]|uniref:hypothetical protein n=1 Tax=Paenibacillus alginolyticus TaxID=59839 RepID=UPI0004065287|nr:hypothetical protein [Paenibacillus alginolyticus]MCY9668253.1 hypothetical protein [Paenibacillus alginolyticus]
MRANHGPKFVPLFFLAHVPRIHVLADHNAIDAHVPHHGRAMSAGLELVVDLFPLVGTLDGSAAFVNQLPLFRISSGLGKKARVVAVVGVVGSTVFGRRTLAGRRAPPLAAILGFVVAIRFHFVSLWADGNAHGRDSDVAVPSRILLASVVKIDERLDVLVIEKQINRFGIMTGIEEHFVYRAQGETLLEFDRTLDQTDGSREAGCRLGYKGKSCLLSAAETMYRWYPLKCFSLALSQPELQSGWE